MEAVVWIRHKPRLYLIVEFTMFKVPNFASLWLKLNRYFPPKLPAVLGALACSVKNTFSTTNLLTVLHDCTPKLPFTANSAMPSKVSPVTTFIVPAVAGKFTVCNS